MKANNSLKVLLLSLGAGLTLLPFWIMLSTSLMAPADVFQHSSALNWQSLFPSPLHWENYTRLFETLPMGQYFFNSLMISLVTTIVQALLSAMAAYAFARLSFPGKTPLFFCFLITLMVPPQVNIVPLFFLMKSFHWIDSYWALIVPGLFSAFGVFLLRQWFMGLPKELEEAATLDGCSPWHIFWQIALPLAKPALASLAIFTFITSWNSFMWPLIVTHSEAIQTLPVGIAGLKGSFRDTIDWPLLMAASALSTLPVVIVFSLGQRYFLNGLLAGSLKE